MTAPQVLRSLVLMRVKNWDYRELRERIADGVTLRQFTDYGLPVICVAGASAQKLPMLSSIRSAPLFLTDELLRNAVPKMRRPGDCLKRSVFEQTEQMAPDLDEKTRIRWSGSVIPKGAQP